ncbi:MAG: PqqD family protein [Actinomycetota bacterium]|nr:PqqD family protein [Actinomycetota bacterium]
MSAYRRSPRAVWRASKGMLVAAVPPNPPTRIAGSAALVWSQLAEPVTLDELVDRLARRTGVLPEALRSDVAALLAQLQPLGLVEVVR